MEMQMQAEKNQYREYFKKVAPYIRFHTVIKANDINVQQANFSGFMKGRDTAVTEDNLKRIKEACCELGNELIGKE